MEKKQKFNLKKIFDCKDLPKYVFEYLDYNYNMGLTQGNYLEYTVLVIPDHERGNDHIPISQWFVENGAAKGEVILVNLGKK